MSRRPRTLVNASGIDFYGDRSDEVLTEGSAPGDTFLARLCERWERAATAAQTLGVRVVLMRTAVVLAPDALTLHLMAWPFRLFIGGPLGDGRQWFTWIHIDDVVGLYTWVLGTASISGPVNVVAPDVRTQGQVARALGTVLGRPHGLRTPAAVLRLGMGNKPTSCCMVVGRSLSKPSLTDMRSALQSLRLLCGPVSSVVPPRGRRLSRWGRTLPSFLSSQG